MAKVFLAEDEADLIRLIQRSLELDGHEVFLVATSLPDALEKIKEAKEKGAEIAIIDGNLGSGPGDGPKVFKAIKEVMDIKVISFSGDGVDWGDKILRKPTDITRLAETINQIL